MSKTSIKERNKAIRLAWEREQELVSEGKGTRDWSQEQQKDILNPEKGKAYDENGRAFEGQHMKSAAEYPEYQGDPNNIQFLTREEHLEAHKGSWQNLTNWYYNPETSSGQTQSSKQDGGLHNVEHRSQKKIAVAPPEVHESFGDKILHAVDAVREFSEKHPVLTGIVKWGGAAAAAIATAAIASNSSGGGRSSENSDSDYSSSDSYDDYSDNADDEYDDDYSDSYDTREYPDERSSPREHDVSGYDRQQNGKTVHVNPYKRGSRHNEE